MDVKARCLVTFKDGNIFTDTVKIDQVITVTEQKFDQITASGGKFEIISKIIPPPVKSNEAKG